MENWNCKSNSGQNLIALAKVMDYALQNFVTPLTSKLCHVIGRSAIVSMIYAREIFGKLK